MRPVVLILSTAHVQAHELTHIYRLHIHIVTSGKDLHIISLLRMNALSKLEERSEVMFGGGSSLELTVQQSGVTDK